MQKNDIVTLKVLNCTADGNGVCRADGLVVFVPGALPGEEISAHILKVKKNCAFAKIAEVITPSPDRIEPACAISKKCGGCCFCHIDYSAEAELKRKAVTDALQRIGKLDITVNEILTARPDRYRNKAQYPVNESGEIGFFANHSHRIVPCDDCILQPKLFSEIVETVRIWMKKNGVSGYCEQTKCGIIRHIYIRIAEATGEIMITLVATQNRLPATVQLIENLKNKLKDSFKTLVLNVNDKDTNVILSDKCTVLYGDGYITDVLCGLKVRLSPLSFYQVNRTMAQRLYEKAKEYAECKGKTVLDLYCGAGTIGLSMADIAKDIIGVEIIPQAVEDAKFNAEQNGIKNARFICGDATFAAQQLKNENLKPDVVILDPPRKGCDKELIEAVANSFCPERVVYVSCDPATLARDCGIFAYLGYKVIKATACDLFPRTAHVETVTLLARTDSVI